jgi:hypothetical protein
MRATVGRGPRTAARFAAAGTAALIVVVVIGAGYGLQAATLRAPTHGELVAADIEQALLWYRYVRSEIHVTGQPVRQAECLEGWLPRRPGRPRGRGAWVAFSDGERLLLGDRRVERVAPGRHPSPLPPVAEVQLAGCGRALTGYIYAHLVDGRRAAAQPASFAGRPADLLSVTTRRTRFKLYSDPETHAPLGLRVYADGMTAWSRVRQVRLTPSLKRAFLMKFDG